VPRFAAAPLDRRTWYRVLLGDSNFAETALGARQEAYNFISYKVSDVYFTALRIFILIRRANILGLIKSEKVSDRGKVLVLQRQGIQCLICAVPKN